MLDPDGDLPAIVDHPMREYFVIKQDVDLEVNFRDRRIDGSTDIYVVVFSDRIEEISLDAAHCQIDTDNITITEMREVNGEPVEGQKGIAIAEYDDPYEKLSHAKSWNWRAEHHDVRRKRARSVFHNRRSDVPAENRELEGCTPTYGSLRVRLRPKGDTSGPKGPSGTRLIIRKATSNLDSPDKTHRQFRIHIPFTNQNPRDGLHFVGVDALDNRFTHMYTRHSLQPGIASCIFPCVDDHGSRCDWKISIKYPRTLGDALQQALATQQNGTAHGSSDKPQADGQDRMFVLAEEDKLREMTVVCSGFLMEEKPDPEDDHKKIMVFEPEKKVSVQKLGFAVGPFEHLDLSSEFRTEEDEMKLGMNALKVHAYCLPHRADLVRNTAAALTMAADFLTYTFAKYPFGNFKICFLDDMVEDTVSLQSVAFVSNRLLFPDDIIDVEIDVTRKVVFTLAYQWTGINMVPNTRNDLWLVIGIAHYMTDLFMKKLCGNNEYRFRMKTLSDKLVEVDIDRPSLYDLGPVIHLGEFEMDFMLLKAPVILFILDKRLSKASGGHGLTRILQKLLTKVQIDSNGRATILDTEKFRMTCEKASRYRLETFWNQWVYGSGCPKFDIKARFNKKRLCVELTLNQTQLQATKKPQLEKDDFLRVVKERRATVTPGKIQALYTGPMTVRIHEADGTPYEHILEIREDATRSTKFEIPYNTKYKRLKRTRRMKEKHSVGTSIDAAAETADDTLLYCLGDVLQGPDDMRDWELLEWDPETERKMDQESYEWIRVDADFEWACDMKRSLEPYMYVSQLQQDRDVVAQQDAMLYLASGPLHPIASGFLVRTLLDRRYFHGIRTMAAKALPRQANIKDIPMLGLRQLIKSFREMFCYEGTNQPKPNDFSNKKQYNVRIAIIKAIAEVRDSTYRCPLEARSFILDQLLYNNNEDNQYSDHYWIALLVEMLATSMIPSKQDDWYARQSRVPNEDERQFLEQAMEQIDRVLRRDEWTNSYQNVWTIAGLDAKKRLMKAEIIPKNLAEFGQYLLDGTRDLIRIKCFEALIDLGAMMEPAFFAFLFYALQTDRSPFVRGKLIQAVARGLAAIAFGEHTKAVKDEPAVDEEADPLLLVQDSAQEIEARKEKFARKENLDAALRALRKEMEETYGADERHYSAAVRKALDQPNLGRAEVESLLDLAAMMFEESDGWVLTLKLPKKWTLNRSLPAAGRVRACPNCFVQMEADHLQLMVKFKSRFKTTPDVPLERDPIEEKQQRLPTQLQRNPSIKINTKAPAHRPSLAATLENDTIVASPSHRPGTTLATSTGALGTPAAAMAAAATVKRPRPDKEDSIGASPAPKRPKVESPSPAPSSERPASKSRWVTLKTRNPSRMALVLNKLASPPPARTALPSAAAPAGTTPDPIQDSITAKPARKPLPTGGEPARKPLPTGASASPPPAAPAPRVSMTINTSMSPPPPAGSPTEATPVSASGARKIKIIRRPQPPPAG